MKYILAIVVIPMAGFMVVSVFMMGAAMHWLAGRRTEMKPVRIRVRD